MLLPRRTELRSPLVPRLVRDHPVAIARLHALWLAWQELTDPATCGYTGPSAWHRDHYDPCRRELRNAAGPFSGCTKCEHQVAHRLPGLGCVLPAEGRRQSTRQLSHWTSTPALAGGQESGSCGSTGGSAGAGPFPGLEEKAVARTVTEIPTMRAGNRRSHQPDTPQFTSLA
ncbi:DUF4913 domain-containing protein [Streptomyces sp. NBC_01353]|uniref:DUF4913 domain-containing protein n=1 Tax=Streptomyces sp. NBC_01353 TaxID=2903835 RepID=UPI002E2F71BD|nr:DUF4913 domain-containing protein [Streptomyces sp. NBC_01353]